ncbi:MAG: 30S ribosomal protein S16 [Cytophagales bacterium]|nr:30S ribosomal protein S16 [Cytophagales bacterium]
MAVKIRLARRGRKKLAMYDIVVADSRSPRDGRFIEKLGTYNPNTDPATIALDDSRALDWVMKGASPTDTARSLLSHRGIMLKKHLQLGVNKGAISQEEAEKRFEDWRSAKEDKVTGVADAKTRKAEAEKTARLEAEVKKNQARAEAIAKKNIVVEEAPAEEASAPVETIEAATEVATEAAVAPEEATEAAGIRVSGLEPAGRGDWGRLFRLPTARQRPQLADHRRRDRARGGPGAGGRPVPCV